MRIYEFTVLKYMMNQSCKMIRLFHWYNQFQIQYALLLYWKHKVRFGLDACLIWPRIRFGPGVPYWCLCYLMPSRRAYRWSCFGHGVNVHTYLIRKLEWTKVVIPGSSVPQKPKKELELLFWGATNTNDEVQSTPELIWFDFLESAH